MGLGTVDDDYTGLSFGIAASASFAWLTAADEVRIKAGGDANDTAAGSGAQEVTVWGLLADLTFAKEAIATNGATVSTKTTQKFFRVSGPGLRQREPTQGTTLTT